MRSNERRTSLMKFDHKELLQLALLGLEAQHAKDEQRLAELRILVHGRGPGRPPGKRRGRPPGIPVTAATRKRMAQAQRRLNAERRKAKEQAAAEQTASEVASRAAAKKRRHFSAATRKRMSEAQKRRFANLSKQTVAAEA
jgi:hypothetical protein